MDSLDGWNDAPSNLIDIAACQQGENSNLAQIWALDADNVLHSCTQTDVNKLGKWSEWKSPWQSAPKLTTICAVSQAGTDSSGSNRGAQIWGIHSDGMLLTSIFEQSPGTDSTAWQTTGWSPKDPSNLTAVAACQSWENAAAFLWALNDNGNVFFRQQTGPGEDWKGWEAWE